jgi:adenylate kinase family enzyme
VMDRRMQRVSIVGSAGSGKSTLARRLGEITGLPVIHIDTLFWLPGWVSRPDVELDALLLQEVVKDRWIIDGNYSRTLPARLAAADTVIWLDFGRPTCLWRAVKRRILYHGRSRPDMTAGCQEKIDLEFLLWIWRYPARSRARTAERLAGLDGDKTVLRFRRPHEADRWLAEIRT